MPKWTPIFICEPATDEHTVRVAKEKNTVRSFLSRPASVLLICAAVIWWPAQLIFRVFGRFRMLIDSCCRTDFFLSGAPIDDDADNATPLLLLFGADSD